WEDASHSYYALDQSAIVATTNPEGVITYVNDMFCQISGYSREDLVGRTHSIVNSGYHSDIFFTKMWETIKKGKIWRGEIRNRSKSGEFYWVYTTIVPKISENGLPVQYTAIRFDITPLKRVESEIQQLYEELEDRVRQRTLELANANRELNTLLEKLQETERQRERFVAAITHDLRTPLIGQQRALAIVSRHQEALPESVRPFLGSMAASTEHTLALVQRLLDVHHLESGTVVPVLQPIVLPELIDSALADVMPLATEKQVVLHQKVSGLQRPILLDPRLIRRVLVNLLGNSLAHLDCGGAVTVQANIVDNVLTLRVIDNGSGIEAEKIPRLFERYWTERTRQIGTGLGLSICKLIIEKHGGTISVNSQTRGPKRGTEFVMELPLMSTLGEES
ncbi:MAG: PAS domain-containing sensor histidine kinase, partial [Vampirovibrionales bacterium]